MDQTDLTRAEWRKATLSGGDAAAGCVEVATNLPGIIAVRDSKNQSGPALVFTPHEWSCFLDGVAKGEFTI